MTATDGVIPVPSDLVTLTIDGTETQVAKGTLIIRAAEQVGIEIPRFCDHPALKPVGACRQCLVDVASPGPDGSLRAFPKPQASCTMPVTEGMVVNLAKCCRPIPGDPIIGFFNPGKGLVIHLSDCKNVTDMRMKQMNWLEVEWDKKPSGEFPAVIRLELLNQLGTLAQVASTISRMGANIENVQITNQDSQFSTDVITLCVKDRVHLANVMRELRKLSVVTRISRVRSESKRVRRDDKTGHHD